MAKKKQENTIIEGNLDPKYWVQKSDPLVLMRTVPFSLGELKILDTYISRINASDNTRRTVIFTKEEYEELMGLTAANYRALEKHTKGMLGKIVELQMPNKDFLQFVLFTKAYYHKDKYGKPVIELTCTEEARDLFFCIDKYHYFKYALENVINLNRKSSYLLYLYIVSNRYRSEWDIDLDELRDSVLDCKEQESYQEYKIFKNRVLDPAVKEVNKKTDCEFSYEAIKRGRRVAKIKFTYHSKTRSIDSQMTFEDVRLLANHNEQTKQEQDNSRESEINYGSSLADLLGGVSCDNEFAPEQIRVLQDLVIQVVDRNSCDQNSYELKCCDYLTRKIHMMNAYDKEKQRYGDRIGNRFKYLCSMIQQDIDKEE